MKKRLISFLLVLVMVLSLIPAMAPMVQAADFYWMQVSQMDDYPDGYYDEYGHFTSQKPYDYDYNEYIHYSDGSATPVSMTSDMLTGFDPKVSGTQVVTVTVQGLSEYFTIYNTAAPEPEAEPAAGAPQAVREASIMAPASSRASICTCEAGMAMILTMYFSSVSAFMAG